MEREYEVSSPRVLLGTEGTWQIRRAFLEQQENSTVTVLFHGGVDESASSPLSSWYSRWGGLLKK